MTQRERYNRTQRQRVFTGFQRLPRRTWEAYDRIYRGAMVAYPMRDKRHLPASEIPSDPPLLRVVGW